MIPISVGILYFGGTAKSAVNVANVLFSISALLLLAAALADRSREVIPRRGHPSQVPPEPIVHHHSFLPKFAFVIALLTLGSCIHEN